MANILLVEPDYRSKFPPLGLLRISSFHKNKGDQVTFTRGKDEILRNLKWHKIYVASLFTYELPRTVQTIRYYSASVDDENDIIVGGIAATLLPEYVKAHARCRVICGPLDKRRMLDNERIPISELLPDYSIINNPKWRYSPEDSYFCRATIGCIRKCKFCAVPILEPEFSFHKSVRKQIREVKKHYGEKQNLILLDNNILASDSFDSIISDISKSGFHRNATNNNKKRIVDFNQGIDARLIDKHVAELLSSICLSPVRLAFDYLGIERKYTHAIHLLANEGLKVFTNYVMYNFKDDPASLYYRLRLNAELSFHNGIRITSFPMKYIPVGDVNRRHIDPGWKWRYLRGIQCILHATHGLSSANLEFFEAAFGASYEQFLEILAMPDRYIIFREKYSGNGADEWAKTYRRLSKEKRNEFLDILGILNRSRKKEEDIKKYREYKHLLNHYYPGGKPVTCE